MTIDLSVRKKLRQLVRMWFTDNARSFVWRMTDSTQAPNPYVVFVSETMLQQTQTTRVESKLPIFLRQFPDFKALSTASNAEIIMAWQGMGYNSRALRLRDCAKEIMTIHNGILPTDYNTLIALPGVGAYTASAVLSFAFLRNVAVVDVNIKRVYSRLFAELRTTSDSLEDATIRQIAETVYPKGSSSLWHQAIMDIGALYCKSTSPLCSTCPLQVLCLSAHKLTNTKKQKIREPMYRNVPQRIWRGKIIELLRAVPEQQFIRSSTLLEKLFSDVTTTDNQWLNTLLLTLEREQFIEVLSSARTTKIRLKQ